MSAIRNGERILKKIECLSICKRAKRKEIALVVRELSVKFPLTELLKLSGIPRITYYYFQNQFKKDYSFDMENIKEVFELNKGRYVHRRITIALNKLPV